MYRNGVTMLSARSPGRTRIAAKTRASWSGQGSGKRRPIEPPPGGLRSAADRMTGTLFRLPRRVPWSSGSSVQQARARPRPRRLQKGRLRGPREPVVRALRQMPLVPAGAKAEKVKESSQDRRDDGRHATVGPNAFWARAICPPGVARAPATLRNERGAAEPVVARFYEPQLSTRLMRSC
jgi:hypothetical protein